MGQLFQIRQLSSALNLKPYSFSCKLTPMAMAMPPSLSSYNRSSKFPSISSPKLTTLKYPLFLFSTTRSRLLCKINDSDMISQLEIGKPEEKRKLEKSVNGIFWILLLNIGLYVADHLFQVRGISDLYLNHYRPVWYQFVTATFCHANWNHLSSNLFFLYIFGKLVEEEEGNFALWLSYILTGAGANLVSWLILPRNAVSVGASGAVFGLFAISVLVKISWDWRKILEVLILGQFVIERVNTCDVLQIKRSSMVLSPSSCILCKKDAENIDHLLLHCNFVSKLWWKVGNIFFVVGAIPKSWGIFLRIKWFVEGNKKRVIILWRCCCLAIAWCTWLERNSRMFEGKFRQEDEVWSRVVFLASL